ncbi:MAG TPA: response regulator [Nitrospiraceae bacterium]|nr:response regulator [Nitrospiraceae bacterium]
MSHGRILVVDDEASVRETVRLVLAHAGYEVIEAEGGAQAMETVRAGDNPSLLDAIILDLYMPKVHGQEVIFYLRSKFPAIPIIVLTGKPDVPDIFRSFDEGVMDFLVKPVHPDNLLRAVAKAIQGRGRLPSK